MFVVFAMFVVLDMFASASMARTRFSTAPLTTDQELIPLEAFSFSSDHE
jgi:hypothetical protein